MLFKAPKTFQMKIAGVSHYRNHPGQIKREDEDLSNSFGLLSRLKWICKLRTNLEKSYYEDTTLESKPKSISRRVIYVFLHGAKAWVSQTTKEWLLTNSQNLPLCAFAKFHLCKTYFAKLCEEMIPARRSHLIPRILGNHEILKPC